MCDGISGPSPESDRLSEKVPFVLAGDFRMTRFWHARLKRENEDEFDHIGRIDGGRFAALLRI